MPVFRTGVVECIVSEHEGLQRLDVSVGEQLRRAVLYPRYAHPALAGDRVVLNTTASELGLGSGGEDFVVWNLSHDSYESLSGGHLMKLRYTPAQSDVMSVEAPESPHHEAMASADSLEGMPVVVASLHSQLLPVVAAIRSQRPDARVAYLMSDGGALEAPFSDTVARLRELGWLASVVTVGHAIGGDLEAVNVYSGLLAARVVVGADVTVAGMGPGVVGTGTWSGNTGIELGTMVNAVGALGGRPVVAVRMSSADPRDRHRGVSHHVLTALRVVALTGADVAVPSGAGLAVDPPHRVVELEVGDAAELLKQAALEGLEASHMGRGPAEDPLFFAAAVSSGLHAARLL